MLRVLEGKRLKLTVRVYLPDGPAVEWQAEKAPTLAFLPESRGLWLVQSVPDYTSAPIMPWKEGMIMLVEVNPQE